MLIIKRITKVYAPANDLTKDHKTNQLEDQKESHNKDLNGDLNKDIKEALNEDSKDEDPKEDLDQEDKVDHEVIGKVKITNGANEKVKHRSTHFMVIYFNR